MQALRSVGRFFSPSSLSKTITEAFRAKPAAAPGPCPSPKRASRAEYSLEAIEPRLLLSADVHYPAPTLVTNLTMKVVDAGSGNLKVQLAQTSNPSNVVYETAISQTENHIDIARSLDGSLFADTITIDMQSLELLDPAGDALKITFSGGLQDVQEDKLILAGTANLDFSLDVQAQADLQVTGSITLTDADDDISLTVATIDSGLPPDSIDPRKFYADSDADLDINGVLSAHDITLTATSTVLVDNSSLSLGSLQFAFLYVNSKADLSIGNGAHVVASGNLAASASSRVQAVASMASSASKRPPRPTPAPTRRSPA
jgi:hypothetical protein